MAQEKRQDLIRQIRELEEIYSQQESLLNEGHVYVGELKRKRTVLTSRYKERTVYLVIVIIISLCTVQIAVTDRNRFYRSISQGIHNQQDII